MAHAAILRLAACFEIMWLLVLQFPCGVAVEVSQDLDVNYVAEMLDKLQAYVKQQSFVSHEHFNSELKRLRGAMAQVEDPTNLNLLEETLKHTERERVEAEAASLEAAQYYHTVRSAFGSRGGAPSCDFLTCGNHAVCKSNQNKRAFCECVSCFSGDGFTCRPSKCTADMFYSPQPISPWSAAGSKPDPVAAKDVSLALLGEHSVVVAVRDELNGNQGFLTVGHVKSTEVVWSEWQLFSSKSMAFAPKLVSLGEKILIAYRDAEEQGSGYIVRGQLDKSDLSSFKVELSTPFLLAKELHQTVELVPLSASRVVCLFGENTGGRAVVVQVSDGVNLLGRYHFGAKVPMSHIAATKLTEDSFVVAFRQLPTQDEIGATSKELSATWMRVSDDDLLVISSHHLMMEPRRPDMYLRDVALVSQNLFAYSYYSRAEKQTKMSLVRLHPTTHQMTPVGEPTVLDTGYNSFVGAISLPSGPETPSTFTYMQPAGKSSVAKVCGVSAEGQVSGCKEVPWAEAELVAADAVKLPDGRLFFAFIQKGGTVQTRFLSAGEASAQDINMAVV
ncbi:unnamed protein product [Durusdinium trenchii]|uniref:EGF-like domain-containing protein n=2 Tax=Durusdinium trenchii TaxID=1381693 RepID=A0ABP0I3N5_9DINO